MFTRLFRDVGGILMKFKDKLWTYPAGVFFLFGYHVLVPIGPLLFLFDREVYWELMETFMPWRWGND